MTSKNLQKNENELETLVHIVKIYSQDRGMEFGIEKCAMLVMKSGKQQLTDGMEQPNQDKIRTLAENETYKYLGILRVTSWNKWKWKTNFKNNITGELESYSRHSYLAKTLSKE